MPEITHDYLVEMARKWLVRGCSAVKPCGLVVTELARSGENPDAIGWPGVGGWSVLVECKATRADFKSDSKKYFRKNAGQGMGYKRYYMAPKGLIAVSELPAGWGLVEVENGKTRLKYRSKPFTFDTKEENSLLLSLIRRLKIRDCDEHIAIRAYKVQTSTRPRATVTFNTEVNHGIQ